jgi:hypothetical protein
MKTIPKLYNPRDETLGMKNAINNIELLFLDPRSIALNKYNVNQLQVNIYENLANSLLKYGFIKPILVRSGVFTGDEFHDNDDVLAGPTSKNYNYEVVDGQHRLMIAKEHRDKFKKIPCIVMNNVDDEMAKTLIFLLTHAKGEFNLAKSCNVLRTVDLGEFSRLTKIPMSYLLVYAAKPLIYTDSGDVINKEPDLADKILATVYLPKEALIQMDKLFERCVPLRWLESRGVLNIYRDFVGRLLAVSIDNVVKGTELGRDIINQLGLERYVKEENIIKETKKLKKKIKRLNFLLTGMEKPYYVDDPKARYNILVRRRDRCLYKLNVLKAHMDRKRDIEMARGGLINLEYEFGDKIKYFNRDAIFLRDISSDYQCQSKMMALIIFANGETKRVRFSSIEYNYSQNR